MHLDPSLKSPEKYVWARAESEQEAYILRKAGSYLLRLRERLFTGGTAFQVDTPHRLAVSQLEELSDSVTEFEPNAPELPSSPKLDEAKESILSTVNTYDTNAERGYEGFLANRVVRDAEQDDKITAAVSVGLAGAAVLLSLGIGAGIGDSVYGESDPGPTPSGLIKGDIGQYSLIPGNPVTYPQNLAKNGAITSLVECTIEPNNVGTLSPDPQGYASVYNPVINKLGVNGVNNDINTQQLVYLGPDTLEAGLVNHIDVSISGDNVTISDPSTINGIHNGTAQIKPYKGKDSPAGSFTLESGSYAEGQFGLMDYTIDNENGTFEIGLTCDPEETQILMAKEKPALVEN